MKKFYKILLFFLLFFSKVTITLAQVKIEVKAFDGNTIFVFYHDQEQVLHINSKDNLITVNMDSPSDFVIINPLNFYKFAEQPVLSVDKRSIYLVTKEKFASNTIINGEKLTAIKFISLQDQDKDKVLDLTVPEMKEQEVVSGGNLQDTYHKLQQVKYSYLRGEHKLSFDTGGQNVGIASFFRGKYLWVIFDKHKKFTLAKNKIFTDFIQLENDNSAILRIKTGEYKNAKLLKNGPYWDIVLSNKIKKLKGPILAVKTLSDDNGIRIDGNFVNNKIIEFNDPEIGDVIKVLPLQTPNTRVSTMMENIEFNVTPTVQGIAVILTGDNVQFIRNNNSLSIISKHNLSPVSAEVDMKIDTTKEADTKKFVNNFSNDKTLLPILDKKLDVINFNYNKSRLIFESSLAENSEQIFAKRFELSKFFFMHGLYHESLSALKLSKDTTAKEYNNNLHAQFLTAVCYTLTGFFEEAKNLYSLLLQKPIDIQEITLWNNYNEFLIGNNPRQLGFLDNLKFINLYPTNIYWPIALAEIELSLLSNDLNRLELISKDLRPAYGNYANSLNYYKANYYKKQHKFELAKQYFQELSLKSNDPFNMVRSGIDLIKLQLVRKEITLKKAISRLNKLRFVWRGDKLEYDLLMLIANYYRDNNESIKACRTYKYIQNSFPNGPSNFYITSEMVKIFNDAFLPKDGSNNIDDFSAVSLFYEFKDMNPIGAQGDQVILTIAKRLIKLDLLEEAIALLKHQVMYRLTGEKRIVNADCLAVILLIDKKPIEAIKILDETDKDNFKFNEHQYRRRLRAKACIDLKKYVEALAYLKEDDTNDAAILRKECLFQSKQWQQYIDIVEPLIAKLTDIEITDSIEQDIVRIGIAYTMQNNFVALERLSKILDTINNSRLKDTIDLLLINSANINYTDLDASLNINQIQIILDKYKNQIFDKK